MSHFLRFTVFFVFFLGGKDPFISTGLENDLLSLKTDTRCHIYNKQLYSVSVVAVGSFMSAMLE